jgi:hypothetical protein
LPCIFGLGLTKDPTVVPALNRCYIGGHLLLGMASFAYLQMAPLTEALQIYYTNALQNS